MLKTPKLLTYFNSNLVRLKEIWHGAGEWKPYLFQFQSGTIKGVPEFVRMNFFEIISIPIWYD